MSKDRVLVTGGTGFVGSAVTRALLARGFAVTALVRPSSVLANLDGLDVTIVQGDMRDARSVQAAAQDARYLFHVAADYRLWARDPEEIVRANRDGTAAVMQAALAAKVERVVYTSSVATLGAKPGQVVADESRLLTEETAIGAYKRSKVAAERLVHDMVAQQGLPAVIVNPSTPIGARDIKPTPTGRIIVEAANGKMPAFVDTGLNLVHVDDVGEGHLLALEKGVIGERYILGGQDVSLRQLLSEIAVRAGRKPPTVNLPRGPLYPLAYLAETWAQVSGKEPMLTRDALTMSKRHMFFTSAKAERVLGYRARPHDQALDEAMGWFRQNGSIK